MRLARWIQTRGVARETVEAAQVFVRGSIVKAGRQQGRDRSEPSWEMPRRPHPVAAVVPEQRPPRQTRKPFPSSIGP